MGFRRDAIPRPNQVTLYQQQRDLVRSMHAARNIQPGGGLTLDVTGGGAWLSQPPAPVMGIFCLRDQDCDWRQETRAKGWPENWHYTVGRPVLYYYADGTWAIPGTDSDSSSSGILDQYIVHPTGYPEPIADDQRLHDAFWPLYSAGDWVWCIWEPESGHWAIHDGYESWLRFELAEDLAIGKSADAYLVRCQQCPEGSSSAAEEDGTCPEAADEDDCEDEYQAITDFTFKVYDGLCGQEGIVGQRGYCKFFAESRRFEVIQLAPKVFWRFELAEDLDQWSSTPVKAYRRCYSKSGYGSYETDCEKQFKVKDESKIGYFGYVEEGATGVCEMHRCESGEDGYMKGWIGVITDLRCPVECICGDEGPDASCDSSSGS